MHLENINTLIERVKTAKTKINFGSWHECYAGMAWELAGKVGHPATFDLAAWLDIDEATGEKLTYLQGLAPKGGRNIEYFNGQTLEWQKATLVRGLESLRDTGEVAWK